MRERAPRKGLGGEEHTTGVGLAGTPPDDAARAPDTEGNHGTDAAPGTHIPHRGR